MRGWRARLTVGEHTAYRKEGAKDGDSILRASSGEGRIQRRLRVGMAAAGAAFAWVLCLPLRLHGFGLGSTRRG